MKTRKNWGPLCVDVSECSVHGCDSVSVQSVAICVSVQSVTITSRVPPRHAGSPPIVARMMSHRSSFFSQVFDGFVAEFSAHIAGWKEVFDSDDPLNAEWPNNFKVKCNPLQRALTMFAIRTDAVVVAVQQIVEAKLGKEYLMVAYGTVSGWFLVRGRTSIFVCTVLLVKMLD